MSYKQLGIQSEKLAFSRKLWAHIFTCYLLFINFSALRRSYIAKSKMLLYWRFYDFLYSKLCFNHHHPE